MSNKIFSSIHSLLLKTERRLLGHDRQTFSNFNGCIITLVGFLKKVWKNLKDNFSKCQKRRERMQRSGAEAQNLPKCKLFAQLMFIRDTIANRPTVSNIDDPASPCESSLLSSNAIHATITTDKTPEQLLSLPTTSQKRSSDRSASRVPMKKAMIDPGDQYIIEALKTETEKEKVIDPDQSFVESIVPILKNLPPKKNRLAKVEIMQLLMKYEFADEES